MIQSITTLSYTVLCQQGPQELLSVQVLLLQALGALSPLLSHRNVSVCLLVSDANLCKDDSDFSDTHFPVTVNIVTLLCSMHGLLLFILK